MRTVIKSAWLRRVGPLSLAGALVLPLSVSGAEGAAPADYGKVYKANHDAMQAKFDQLEKDRRNAIAKAADGDFAQAIKELEGLLKQASRISGDFAKDKSNEIKNNIVRMKRAWSSEIMQEAQDLAAKKEYESAVVKAQQALVLTPDREYITNFITECQKYAQGKEFKKATSLQNVSPDYEKRQSQIDLDLREAKLFIRNKRYESACTRLERVLLVDPFNMEAIDMLAICYDRLFKDGIKRGVESKDIANARNVWEWTEPLSVVQVDRTTDRRGSVRQKSNTDLYNRLERIVFPSVSFNAMTLTQIISYLNEKGRANDPEKEGVAIIDNLSPSDKQRKVSFELGTVPMLDVIRYLSMASGLSYSFRGDKVIFGNVDSMSTEFFPVRGDIIAEIIDSQTSRPTSSGMKDAEGSGGDDAPADEAAPPDTGEVLEAGAETSAAADAAATRQKQDSAALKAYFSDRWVTFENGANIIYSPRGERLMVRNTAENLRRMDALLRQLDALEQPMVMVEAKLIELSDTNLNELGFEWMFSAKPGNGSGGGWSLGTVDPTRHGTGSGMFRVINNLKIFPNFGEKIFGADNNVDLSLSVNAVAQNRQAEVLASPRILSESGPKKPAMIKMTEKTYFITEWEEPDVETDGFNITLDSTDPEWDDDAYDLGVTFSVTPVVQADNYTITLNNIHPVFLNHTGDHDYIVSYEAGQYIDGAMVPVMKQTFNLRMPEIARREMTTNITLYDGETVLLGGMADNESIVRDDKWPVLGDIPLLGRLFQDQMSNVTNRTLLIFITARLINPNGMPVRSVRERGLVEFNR
ncbi:MAG: hypothetical protein E7052_03495 [Lentisphaerae bacterium]|nr:hypothetical protein [Lentisphaerota bacterium]